MNVDEVVISDPGGANARRIPVVGVQCGWELSNIGEFSGFARIEDLRAAGLGVDLEGKWVDWSHPLLGRWGGIIEEPPVTDGVVEISAEGFAGLLRGHVLDEWVSLPDGTPAGLLRRAFLTAVSVDGPPTFITLGDFDDSGIPISVALGGQDLLTDVLPQLAEDGGLEWSVDADRVLTAGQRLGRDLSASVRWYEGREIVTYKRAGDKFAATAEQALQVESLQEEARHNIGGTLRLQSKPMWRQPRIAVTPTVTGRTPATKPMQFTLLNANNAWGVVTLGDHVRIVVESAQFSGTFRVTGIAFDGPGNQVDVAGEATPDEAVG